MKSTAIRLLIAFVATSSAFLAPAYSVQASDEAATQESVQNDSLSAAPAFESELEKFSYAFAIATFANIQSLKSRASENGVDIPLEPFVQGITDAYRGKSQLTEQEAQEIANSFGQYLEMEAELKRKEQSQLAAEQRNQQNEAFIEAYLQRWQESATQTKSGLVFRAIQDAADGPHPDATSNVTIRYSGELIDGTVFQSEQEHHHSLEHAIDGWREGVQKMPLCSTYQFVIPPEIGYGESGLSDIPAGSILVYTVELLAIADSNHNNVVHCGYESPSKPSTPFEDRPECYDEKDQFICECQSAGNCVDDAPVCSVGDEACDLEEAPCDEDSEACDGDSSGLDMEVVEASLLNYLAEHPDAVHRGVGYAYQVIQSAEGVRPSEDATVELQYTVRRIGQEIMYSTYEQGETVIDDINEMEMYWSEWLQLMEVGSIYRFVLPAQIAFGDQYDGQLPAEELLIFEVELISVEESGDYLEDDELYDTDLCSEPGACFDESNDPDFMG